MTEQGWAFLIAPAVLIHFVAMLFLEARLNDLHASGRWADEPPKLIAFSWSRSLEAYGFVFFASPWKTRDAFALICFYLARLSFLGFLVFAGMAFRASFRA